ncbi:MAG: septal ring lytic transglycosylase RlpA family protein [Thermonemataceae bacterium]|nr:septal ring lytic transglycosylase RlpA family protein [Thermonemataceae bacterium]
MRTLLTFFLIYFHFFAYSQKIKKFTQTGMASYYAGKFHGRKTASGEIYDKNKLSAAHRTLPFGTMLKVTNLKNNKSVIVKVTDRGPFAHARIIDLSQAAAQNIDMIRSGTAKVQIETVGENGKLYEIEKPKEETPDKPKEDIKKPEENTITKDTSFLTGNTYSIWGTKRNPKGYGIQVGSYGDLDNAKELCKSLQQAGIQEAYIQVGWNEKRIYRVLVGSFENEQSAENQINTIRKSGFDGIVKKHFD